MNLERAHILSRPDTFTLAIRRRDRREALGRFLRIVVAAPASPAGRYPEGDTGRAHVGLRQPMPTPPDPAALMDPATA